MITGESIEKGAHRIIKILDNMRNVLSKYVDQPIVDGQKMISDVSPYRLMRYAFICRVIFCKIFSYFILRILFLSADIMFVSVWAVLCWRF